MAADGLDAYQADTKAGRDALLVCDTTEMAHAINRRIHHERIDRNAPTVAGMDGQRIGVGDLVVSRRNDPTIGFHASSPNASSLPSVRNGNRWRVAAIDTKTNRVAAERLDNYAPPSPSTAITSGNTSAWGTPSPCTPPKESPPTPATPSSAKTPVAHCSTSR